MKQGKVVIISGPSGSGKTTLHQMLLKSPRLKNRLVKSISATTRASRPGEKHGREYLFLTLKMFKYKIHRGHFLEWQKVFDNYYGTPKKNVEELLRNGKHVLLCIDVKGAKVISRIFPQAVKIFIEAPSLEVLKERLDKRSQDAEKSIRLRLKMAKQELKEAKNYQYRIVNDDLKKSVKRLEQIVSEAVGL